MASETIDTIKTRKFFYRDNFRRLSTVLVVVLFLILLLVIAIIYFVLSRSEKDYYASSYVSELTKLRSVKRGTGLLNPEKEPEPAVTK